MTKRSVSQLASILFIATVLLHTAHGDDETASTLTQVGNPVPAFKLHTLDGKDITRESTKGKVTLICFFATWCGPCMEELPEMQTKIWAKYKDRGLAMVAVGREHTEAEMKTFAEAHPEFTFQIAPDPKRETYSLFATSFIPRSYLMGTDGKILFQAVGYDPDEIGKLAGLINTALNIPATQPAK